MEGINKSIYSTFKRTGGRKKERDREWRRVEIMNKKSRRDQENRIEKERKRSETPGHRAMRGKGGNKRANAPVRFDFAGWVRNNSANYYSALVHIDRYVAPDLYIAWL